MKQRDEIPETEFDQLLALARRDLATRASATDPRGFEAMLAGARDRERRRQRVVVGALVMIVLVWLSSIVAHPISAQLCEHLTRRDIAEIGLIPAANVLVCLALLQRPHAGAQMLLRASCWSFLVLGALSTIGSPGLLPWAFPAMAIGGGVALLGLGLHGLEPERYRGAFVPIAHRRTLTWTIILAVADTQSLAAVNHANHWSYPLTTACALGMLVAVVGLYRLEAWGLWLNLGLNLAIGALAVTGTLPGLPRPLALMLATTALAQIALSVPLLRSIFGGRVPDEHDEPRAWPLQLARALILVVMATTVAVALRGPDPEARAAYCAVNDPASPPKPPRIDRSAPSAIADR